MKLEIFKKLPKAPAKPLKGRGYDRYSFKTDRRMLSEKEKVAFWEALPDAHKTVVGTPAGRGFTKFEQTVSLEALRLWEEISKVQQ
jgi:hypothetical protein